MERLTVLLLINDLRIGGAERQAVELALGLDPARFRPLVATLYGGQPLEQKLWKAGVPVTSLDRRHRLDFGTVAALTHFLRRERVDVIQPFLTPATFFGLSAALLARTPVKVVTERCGLRVRPGLGSNLYRFVEDRLTRFADAAIPNSDAGRLYLIARGIRPESVRVIYNGISPARTAVTEKAARAVRDGLGIPRGARVAGIVASLTPAKDHETFLRAAARVSDSVADAHFVIVGDGELRANLEAQARDLGLGTRVHFTGNVDDVAPYIAAFDVAALSSCDHEGCSNALLEAMALARPCVATQVGGNAELVADGESGLVVPPRDPQRLAAAMTRLLASPERARAMGRAGRARFEARFTVERMVRAYEDLYTELWARRAARAARDVVAAPEEAKVAK